MISFGAHVRKSGVRIVLSVWGDHFLVQIERAEGPVPEAECLIEKVTPPDQAFEFSNFVFLFCFVLKVCQFGSVAIAFGCMKENAYCFPECELLYKQRELTLPCLFYCKGRILYFYQKWFVLAFIFFCPTANSNDSGMCCFAPEITYDSLGNISKIKIELLASVKLNFVIYDKFSENTNTNFQI